MFNFIFLLNLAFFEVLASNAEINLYIPFEEFLPPKTNVLLDIKVGLFFLILDRII